MTKIEHIKVTVIQKSNIICDSFILLLSLKYEIKNIHKYIYLSFIKTYI